MTSELNGTGAAAIASIMDAAWFAARKHASQRRKGATAEPYVNHLLEVASLVASSLSQPDPSLVIAALLHDVIEDAGVTRDELEELFGADVASLVMEVTDDKSLPKPERKRLQVVNAPKKSARAQRIKLADKISNLRSILACPPENWDFERKQEYFAWARRVVDGLSTPDAALKAEFERVHARAGELASANVENCEC
jgi:(p)ppGpp synthase/HD superfamily hydrolase